MIADDTRVLLEYLDVEKCFLLTEGKNTNLKEKAHDGRGKVNLNVIVSQDCIIAPNFDKNVYNFIVSSNQMIDCLHKDARRCCDHLIIVPNSSDGHRCEVHAFEFTDTINYSQVCDKLVPQFKMGIINAGALTGFLHLKIVDVKVYVCFKNDYTESGSMHHNACYLRKFNNGRDAAIIKQWKSGYLNLELPMGTRPARVYKIQQDFDGSCIYQL